MLVSNALTRPSIACNDSKGNNEGGKDDEGGKGNGDRATRTTAVMMVTVMPNGNEDNKDGNSKNKDKAMTKPTTTTEEGERRQSHRDNRGGGHHRPLNSAIAPTAASSWHTFFGSCCLRVERSVLATTWEYIEIWTKHEKKSGTGARSGMVG